MEIRTLEVKQPQQSRIRTVARSRVSCALSWPLIVLHRGWSWDGEDDHDLGDQVGDLED